MILYGKSVFLAGLKAGLEREAALKFLMVEAGAEEVAALVHQCHPRALLFDLAEGQPDFAVSLLREQEGLELIGVDPSSNELLILSSRSARGSSLQDVLDAIHRAAPQGT